MAKIATLFRCLRFLRFFAKIAIFAFACKPGHISKNENNPDHIKELNKNAQKRKRFQSTQLHTNDLELLQPAKKKQNCTVADETHEMKMANVIQSFHDSIKCGPEYICTCCDQLWYRSSVTKCDANKYTKCIKNLLDACITGKTSVDKTECSYCSHMMRASSCLTKLYVNVNVEVADQKKTLTIFDDILKATLGELDDQSVDTIYIAKQLLLLENISITFNNKNVVTKMEVTS